MENGGKLFELTMLEMYISLNTSLYHKHISPIPSQEFHPIVTLKEFMTVVELCQLIFAILITSPC